MERLTSSPTLFHSVITPRAPSMPIASAISASITPSEGMQKLFSISLSQLQNRLCSPPPIRYSLCSNSIVRHSLLLRYKKILPTYNIWQEYFYALTLLYASSSSSSLSGTYFFRMSFIASPTRARNIQNIA